MYNNLDLNALGVDDIVEEYKLLHERHQQLKQSQEQDAQIIHELKRSLDTAHAAERYLSQELEQLSVSQNADNTMDPRMQQELEELRRKYKNLQAEQETLQLECDAKTEETSELKAKLETATRELEANAALRANSGHDECTARALALEQENSDLMQKLADYDDAKVQSTFAVAEQEKQVEILKDQVSCLEENLRSKRDELEEKLQLLESTQEQLVEANSKIAMLQSVPENNERKGNSLFAEVDDQRQVMKQLLASQKKSYLEMKKIFNESKFEIHRLKRENIAMHTELKACSTIFCNADKTYQDKLNQRIRHLMLQNTKLEQTLNVTQERLRDLANDKRETGELKSQLHSVHIQKASLEQQLRNVQQDMARWRFESLKSRCVLIDRENRLTEHKISFKPMQSMEFDIKEAQLQAALPRIVSVATAEVVNLVTPMKAEQAEAAAAEIIVLDTPMKKEVEEQQEQVHGIIKVKSPEQLLKTETLEEQQQMPAIKMEPAEIKCEEPEKATPLKPCLANIKAELAELDATIDSNTPIKNELCYNYEDLNTSLELNELELASLKPQRKGTPVKIKCANSEASSCQIRSILIKKRDIFAEDCHKNVQFSHNAPTVHNLSPDVEIKENQNPLEADTKPIRKTPNIIRRIVVASKKPTS
ncbi:Spindly [Drosophila busckii]|uniref:Spindly n=1 Tax=Drosophila busckii TaxID=30019 RepID=A0A0M5J1E1_DROBS|nr:Spindly [Drosophila busckii]